MTTSTAPSPTAPAHRPVLPLKVQVSEVLSQDVITAAGVHVDRTSSSPLAVFRNPHREGAPHEALVVSAVEGGKVLLHVAPTPGTSTGWDAVKLFDAHQPTEVAVITGKDGKGAPFVECFFLSGGSAYRSVLHADGTWSGPHAVDSPKEGGLKGLKVSYAASEHHELYPLVSAGTAENAGWVLAPGRPHAVWTRLDDNAQITRVGSRHWVSAAAVDGQLHVNYGDLGKASERWAQPVPGYPQVSRVVGAFGDPWRATFVVLHADGTLHMWHCGPQGQPGTPHAIGGLTFRTAVAHLCAKGKNDPVRWDVYGIDDKNTLWAMRQDPVRPVDDGGVMRWLPPTPLDKGIDGVAASVEPVAAPTLFSYGKNDKGLRLETQDPVTSMWREQDVHVFHTQAYEVTHYRVEVSVTDAGGAPAANLPVRLRPAEHASACTVLYRNAELRIPREGVALTTDACGKVSFAVAPDGLGASLLELTSEHLDKPVPVQPGHAVHTYLSGKGKLRDTDPDGALPPFDEGGKLLMQAKARGSDDKGSLAPRARDEESVASVAAQAIRKTALVGLGGKLPGNAVGVMFSMPRQAGPGSRAATVPGTCVLLRDQRELDAALAELRGTGEGEEGTVYNWFTDRWNDVKHVYNEAVEGVKKMAEEARQKLKQLGGDLLRAAKNGLIKISKAVLNGLHELSEIEIQIENAIVKGIKTALHGLEQAAHFVANVFHQIEAFVEKVIAWLKALFDLKAIWNTKRALEQAIRKAPLSVKQATEAGRKKATGWLQNEKGSVLSSLDAMIREYSGKKISQVSAPRGGSSMSKVPQSHFTGNAHHNWLMDKLLVTSSTASDCLLQLSLPAYESADAEKLMQRAGEKMADSGKELVAGVEKLAPAVLGLFNSPDGVSGSELAKVLDGTKSIVAAAFDTGTAVVDAGAGLVELAMEGLGKILDTEFNAPVVRALYQWLAKLSGNSDDDKPTVAGVLALVAAVPVTLIYKLAEGVDQQPFPKGKLPADGEFSIPQYRACTLASGILTAVQALPMCVIDFQGAKTPTWLSLLNVLWSAAAIMLACQGWIFSQIDRWPPEACAFVGGLVGAGIGLAFIYLAELGQAWDTWIKPWVALAMTVAGVCALGNVVRLVAQKSIDGYHTVAQSLLAFPNLFAFLNHTSIRQGPEEPLVAAVRMGIDIGGNVPGGIMIAARA
ncbi:hypothetical protein CTZ27_28685 [Streptomyces griseocarneus]|nr:hypothetical protein CTZ27_28685 [Streptomyces griseocarneus]